MIKINNLILKNFLSHHETHLDFQSRQGLVLIEGVNESGKYDSNGAGKSSLLEGIVYALSGNTLRGVGVNEVVNRRSGKDTCVSLAVDADGVGYTINRYRKDTVMGDKLDVYRGDACESKRLNKDTQNYLDSVIGIPYEILVNTMLLGEGLSSRFTQLSDSDKKSLIESTLNLPYDLGKSRDTANGKLKEKKLQKSSLEGSIQTLERITGEQDYADKLTTSLDSLAIQKKKLAECVNEIDKLIQPTQTLCDKLVLLNEHILKIRSLNSRIEELDLENVKLIEEMGEFSGGTISTCPMCHQSISQGHGIDEILSNYREKVEKNEREKSLSVDELHKSPPLSILTEKYEQLSKELAENERKIAALDKIHSQVQTQVAVLNAEIRHYESVQSSYDTSVSELENSKSELLKVSSEIADLDYLYKLFSPTGVMISVLEESINYINSRIKVYTDILLDKDYRLTMTKGKITLIDDGGSSYQSMSNGEKRRLDVAIQFSLHDYTHVYCGNSCNVLFIDEILDTLDTIGVSNILEVLSMKKDYCNLESIFVITHNNTLKDYFDNVTTVVKDRDGNSHIN